MQQNCTSFASPPSGWPVFPDISVEPLSVRYTRTGGHSFKLPDSGQSLRGLRLEQRQRGGGARGASRPPLARDSGGDFGHARERSFSLREGVWRVERQAVTAPRSPSRKRCAPTDTHAHKSQRRTTPSTRAHTRACSSRACPHSAPPLPFSHPSPPSPPPAPPPGVSAQTRFFYVRPCKQASDMGDVARTGAAKRWPERRLCSWLQPFITAVMGGRFRVLAYGHRRRTALVLDGGQESLRILGRRIWVWSARHARAPQVCLLFRTSAVVRCTTRLS